jgi:hypothetical protein
MSQTFQFPTPPEPVRAIRQAAESIDPFKLYSLDDVHAMGIPEKYQGKLNHELAMVAPNLAPGFAPPDFGIPGWQVLLALAGALRCFNTAEMIHANRLNLDDREEEREEDVPDTVDAERAVRVLSGLCHGAILSKTRTMWKQLDRQGAR